MKFGSIKFRNHKGKVKTIPLSIVTYVKYDSGMYSIFMENMTFVMVKPKDIVKGFNHLNNKLEK